MPDLTVDRNGRLPLYRQIIQQIKAQVLSGELESGGQLPSSRQLAHDLGVARITVTQAYEQLQLEGYVALPRPGLHF